MNKLVLLNDKDFSTLTYNVMKHKIDANLLRIFPTFESIDSFRQYKGDTNRVIRYIVLCYDKGSPILNRYMQDDVKRKVLAAQYAGWESDQEGNFSDEVDNILKCKDTDVNAMIIGFIRTFNDPNWALLMTGMESYYQKLQQIMNADFGGGKRDVFQIEETKGKLFKQAQGMSQSLNEAATKLLNDENPFLRRDLYSTIDQEAKMRLMITPERMIGI